MILLEYLYFWCVSQKPVLVGVAGELSQGSVDGPLLSRSAEHVGYEQQHYHHQHCQQDPAGGGEEILHCKYCSTRQWRSYHKGTEAAALEEI